jgi:hypothetical protein
MNSWKGGLVHIGVSKGSAGKWAKTVRAHRGIMTQAEGSTDDLHVYILLPSGSEYEIFHLMKSDKTKQRLQFTVDWCNQ